MNLRTAMPIIKIFNATFYFSVCNVEATLRYWKENKSKCVISEIAICDVELKSSLFQAPPIKLENGSLSKHPSKDANFFVFTLYQIINSC